MGNKMDIYEKQHDLIIEEAYNFANSKKMKIEFVSAKTGSLKIKKFIEELITDYLNKKLEKESFNYLNNLNKSYVNNLIKYINS